MTKPPTPQGANTGALQLFIAGTPASIVDDVRDEAARCADETARQERGERGPLRLPSGLVPGEFSDAACGVAAEVAMIAADALRAAGLRFNPDFPWSTAATLLRSGWKRGQRITSLVLGRGPKS